MVSLSREMNRLFDNMFRGFDDARMWEWRQAEWPRIDVEETDKNYRVTAELPGMDEKGRRSSIARWAADHPRREKARKRIAGSNL